MKKIIHALRKIKMPSLRAVARQRKKKNMLFFSAAVMVVVFAGLLFFGKLGAFSFIDGKYSYIGKGIILFEGKDCDHCHAVDDFIAKNKVQEKVMFTRLEVFHDIDNADLLIDKARICGLDASEIGVPFLWDGGGCILGDIDVIQFFREKITKK
jgi:hypothetical protein